MVGVTAVPGSGRYSLAQQGPGPDRGAGCGGRWESPPAFVTVREEAPPRTAADLPGFVLPM